MKHLDEITHEFQTLPDEQRIQVLDFIAFLKAKSATESQEPLKTPDQIESFLKSFNIDVRSYHFNRDEANAR